MNCSATESRKPNRSRYFLGVTSIILVMIFGRVSQTCAFLGHSSVSRSSRSIQRRLSSMISTVPVNYQRPSTVQIYKGLDSTRLYSSIASSSDESAASKSRAPFRMPRNSADDSAQKQNSDGNLSESGATSSWNKMGLLTEICACLQNELKLPSPTPVQSLVIPQLLKTEKESMAFLAATG